MKLFLTPNATFTTGLRWSDSLEKFVPCDVKGSDYVFEIATPTRAELHEHYGAFMGVPARGGSGLDYSELDEQIWGTENKPGLVRKVLPDIKGKEVFVVGGGNTAMDAVRTARRIGAKSRYI